ncbi:hypothetical protein ACFQ1M_16015 [Sungkyunkwania multivorans]|uniref:Uncharacterized protein n=1 Tax=Sungkyunkwania multivorans TaxID=1173618 RepID=A0ABW3D0Z9_9FLAO
MKKVLILITGILFLNNSFGQEIELKLSLLGYNFSQNGQRLNWKELATVTESHVEANMLIKKAKSHNTISSVLSLIGGGLIGIPIGQSITDQEPNWILAYIGGGVAVISVPFTFSAFNKVNKGIDKYNLSLRSTSKSVMKPEFSIIADRNGLGISINF